jgi:predicted nucleic acid-binding protein
VVAERGTAELAAWLTPEVVPAASALVRTELRRAAARLDTGLLPTVEQVLSRLHLLRLDDAVLDLAGSLAPAGLRSLDALHVASAVLAGVDVVVTYDERMAEAAAAAGLAVVAP